LSVHSSCTFPIEQTQQGRFYIYGLDLSAFSDALDEFGMDAITYAVIKSSYFVTGFFAVLIAVLLSVIFPLRLLKKSKPIEVIND